MAITAPLGLMVVPARLIVAGDPRPPPVFVLELGEPMMILWLVLVGARTKPLATAAAVPG